MAIGIGNYVLVIWILPMFGRHHPGGRVSVWHLKDGTRIRFFIRSDPESIRETIKVLEVTRPGDVPQEFTFAVWHAGYHHVELRTNEDESVVWLLDTNDRSTIGCSLILATGQFGDQGDHCPIGVSFNSGRVLTPE